MLFAKIAATIAIVAFFAGWGAYPFRSPSWKSEYVFADYLCAYSGIVFWINLPTALVLFIWNK